mmetsp:Transcript_2467/g.5706  ORF Transcript_2467/g.5706 Transcript_2467/m.5706 type:complete len:234 (-) Transcript_2467:700-1401(-)
MDRSSFSQAAVALFDSLDTDRAGVLYLDDLRNIMNRVSQRFKTIVEGVLHFHIFEKRSFIITKQEFIDQYSTTMAQWHPKKGADKENIRVVSVKPIIVDNSSATKEALAAFKLLQPQQTKQKTGAVREVRRGRSTQPGVRSLIEKRSSSKEQHRPSSRNSSVRTPSSVESSQLDISLQKVSVELSQPPSRSSSSCSYRRTPVPIAGKFKELYSQDMSRLIEIRRAHLLVSRGV